MHSIQDLAAYKFLSTKEDPRLAESCIRSGTDYYGSLSLDLSFRQLLDKLQREDGINLHPPNLRHYMDMFAKFKLTYRGEIAWCISVVSTLVTIMKESFLLHRDVFEPVVNRQERFTSRVKSIVRSKGADVTACHGAVLYGCHATGFSSVISSIVSPKNYVVSAILPADSEDLAGHPMFASLNSKMALYILHKGEEVSKREPIILKLRVYSESIIDDHFTTMLQAPDPEETFQYAKWRSYASWR
ncbi:hypothetical protein BS47DRAFT_1401601 [Hydnum rufescens UP504]|uniref:Uncharacterized protein n=1 Tax=Hydnum rufescens UP504 TaxID=1448309 RepID=A0A9P6AEK5_9AGAM|nr:hypothetical protein BS47DRAFT_1401601 [Hydnum rufescens UP504]